MNSKKSTNEKEKKNNLPKSINGKKKDSSQKTIKGHKESIPKDWQESVKESSSEFDKNKRRSLISALKRSIAIKGTTPPGSTKEPMNIVITLSPAKHLDIMEYFEENVPGGGRAEWVRDSIRLKMRVERGVYGLNTAGQDGSQKGSEELQTVFGQFAEVMTQVMSDLRIQQTAPKRLTPSEEFTGRARPSPPERSSHTAPPQVKKLDISGDNDMKTQKPDRPSLDDAIGAIVVVE